MEKEYHSVCMATYNGEKYIAMQIASILHQIGSTDELIISDDGSTDQTIAIIKTFQDSRIKLFQDKHFKDPIKNFQYALEQSRGKYIFLADQDDVWMDNKVQVISQQLLKYDLIVSDSMIVDDQLRVVHPSFFKYFGSGKGILKNMIRSSYYGSCMAFRRSVLEAALPFPDTKEIGHDLWLGLVAELKFSVLFLNIPLLKYRRHEAAFTSVAKSRRKLMQMIYGRYIMLKEIIKFLMKGLPMNVKMKTFKEFLYRMYWQAIRMSWRVYPFKKSEKSSHNQYAIGITTYLDRYETLFKPFLLQLVKIFPDTEIVVTANGHYNRAAQLLYLQQITSFAKQFKNVKVVAFEDAQSLSKLWNLLLLNSSSENLFIFNDDLEISPLFRNTIERSGILKERIALINQSWSHFMISKEIIKEVGWFDERFPAIGNEDEDYESRLALKQIPLKIYPFMSIKAIVTQPLSYSYGEEVEVVNEKYLKSNKVFFDSKWEIAPLPGEGFHYVRILNAYVKLREGMETPKYYKE